ncbi:hypothetical protein [Brevundimonas goettingensis]|uniref:Uncharacterized protein n=1 Tax=Brevundimonas goettingensis TaxID=2774190 RepID=A0A975C5Y4_9CAUL|nr:hypothetical protein [Brevundimonas goettingensis]QTC93049.1 hypothetical protein IFJ75_09495 [Brevundimonas goettingensis]
MMKAMAALLATAPAGLLASSALAQASLDTDVPGPPFQGLRWAVAAPAGTGWTLACRFRPVTYRASPYDLHHWANGIRLTGRGPDQGRLPGPDGRRALTLTDGPGPIGLGLAREGARTVSAGTNDPARPARATVF